MDKYCGFNNKSRVNPLRHSAKKQRVRQFFNCDYTVYVFPKNKKINGISPTSGLIQQGTLQYAAFAICFTLGDFQESQVRQAQLARADLLLQISNVKHLHAPPDLRNSETSASITSKPRCANADFSSVDALCMMTR